MEKLRVEVFGQEELLQHLRAGGFHYNCLISIGNPYDPNSFYDTRMPLEFTDFFERILRLEFHDADSSDEEKRIPEKTDIEKVIEFFNSTKDFATGYTIHCRQGVSRSTAVALGILYMIYRSENLAKNILLAIRPGAVPLQRILKFFDEVFDSNLVKAGAEVSGRYFDALREELKEMEAAAKKELGIKPHGLLARSKSIRSEMKLST